MPHVQEEGMRRFITHDVRLSERPGQDPKQV